MSKLFKELLNIKFHRVINFTLPDYCAMAFKDRERRYLYNHKMIHFTKF